MTPTPDFHEHVRRQAWMPAASVFLEQMRDQSPDEVLDRGKDLAAAGVFLGQVLPTLCRTQPDWLLHEPRRMPACIGLVRAAKSWRYQPARMDQLLLQLNCLRAVDELLAGRAQDANRTMLNAASMVSEAALPAELVTGSINGLLTLRTMTVSTLEGFFSAYIDRLRGLGSSDLADRLALAVEPIVHNLRRVEEKPGVVRGLFVEAGDRGTIQNVIATIESGAEGIAYSSLEGDAVRPDMQDASERARKAADQYLRRMGYAEGLSDRRVVWQIADMVGRTKKAADEYEGHSLGLALAIAIVSCYVRHPVPPSVTMTGSFDVAGATEGEVTGVGSIAAKLQAARDAECDRVFLSKENTAQARQSEWGQTEQPPVTFVSRVDEVCDHLFPLKTQSSFAAIASRVLPALHNLLFSESWWEALNVRRRHMMHLCASTILFAGVCGAEAWMVWTVYGPPEPCWYHVVGLFLAVGVAMAGHLLGFGMAAACMEARVKVGWILAAISSFVGMAAYGIVLCLIAEAPHERMSQLAEWPPRLNIAKDAVIIWIFAIVYLHSFYDHVMALEFLLYWRQDRTVKRVLSRRGMFESDLPVQVVTIPWGHLTGVTIAVALFLIGAELYAFSHVLPESELGQRWIVLCSIRALIFIAALGQAVGWYRWALSAIEAEVGE